MNITEASYFIAARTTGYMDYWKADVDTAMAAMADDVLDRYDDAFNLRKNIYKHVTSGILHDLSVLAEVAEAIKRGGVEFEDLGNVQEFVREFAIRYSF